MAYAHQLRNILGGMRQGAVSVLLFGAPLAYLASTSSPTHADAAQPAPPPRKQAEPPLPSPVRAWDSDWDRRKPKVRAPAVVFAVLRRTRAR